MKLWGGKDSDESSSDEEEQLAEAVGDKKAPQTAEDELLWSSLTPAVEDDGGVDEVALEALSTGADEVTPDLPEVEATEIKPRRASKRVKAPTTLYFVQRSGKFVPLEMTVISRDISSNIMDCFLLDVSDGGIGFACPEAIPVGNELTFCAYHEDDSTPLVATTITILNSRPASEDLSTPKQFANKKLWIHGCELEKRDARILYKATLDSLALKIALEEDPE